ncbi:MAG: sialidase family protein [Planctomycetota bacterium]
MPVTSDIENELKRTNPDYIVYVPKSADGSTFDAGNEHFLVFNGPNGSLMTVWTQSTQEGLSDQRIVFSQSKDEGLSWSEPKIIAGAKAKSDKMASWAFPMVSKLGRIYVLYNQHTGINDIFAHTTGLMAGIYSDDNGQMWSQPKIISMPRSKWDNPDPSVPANWIVWQKPLRLSKGKYFVGYTRWVSPIVRNDPPIDSWIAYESVVEFMRFENIDENPEVEDIKISYFANNDEAIRVGFPEHSNVSVVQEPSIVKLPDERLFCVMRTSTGSPYYSISENDGKTWSKPNVLKYHDEGKALLHPLSPCPLYDFGNNKYLFFYHNHDGHFKCWGPTQPLQHRRPINLALGEFRKGARQPIWFSQPKLFMDSKGIPIGYKEGRSGMSMYSSFTIRNNKAVLWYPDRKFFLLGKKIGRKIFINMKIPV